MYFFSNILLGVFTQRTRRRQKKNDIRVGLIMKFILWCASKNNVRARYDAVLSGLLCIIKEESSEGEMDVIEDFVVLLLSYVYIYTRIHNHNFSVIHFIHFIQAGTQIETLTEPTRDHLLLKHKYRCDSSANIDSRILKSMDLTVKFSVGKKQKQTN